MLQVKYFFGALLFIYWERAQSPASLNVAETCISDCFLISEIHVGLLSKPYAPEKSYLSWGHTHNSFLLLSSLSTEFHTYTLEWLGAPVPAKVPGNFLFQLVCVPKFWWLCSSYVCKAMSTCIFTVPVRWQTRHALSRYSIIKLLRLCQVKISSIARKLTESAWNTPGPSTRCKHVPS